MKHGGRLGRARGGQGRRSLKLLRGLALVSSRSLQVSAATHPSALDPQNPYTQLYYSFCHCSSEPVSCPLPFFALILPPQRRPAFGCPSQRCFCLDTNPRSLRPRVRPGSRSRPHSSPQITQTTFEIESRFSSKRLRSTCSARDIGCPVPPLSPPCIRAIKPQCRRRRLSDRLRRRPFCWTKMRSRACQQTQ